MHVLVEWLMLADGNGTMLSLRDRLLCNVDVHNDIGLRLVSERPA